MNRKRLTDEEVEHEISRLKESEHVKLGRKFEAVMSRRRQYMYCLRAYEKKGRELEASGVTLETLENSKDCDVEERI